MTDCKPGAVAEVTVHGDTKRRAMFDGEKWRFAGQGVAWGTAVTDVRPLVVLDPKALNWVDGHSIAYCLRNHSRRSCQIFDLLADEIEAQTKPPRIPEPGLWGVVEASHMTRRVQSWVRTPKGWSNSYAVVFWDDLIDPVLIREGVEG